MSWARVFFGSLVVALGVILLLGYADVLEPGEVIGDWWPLVIVVGGVLSWAANPRHWTMPVILVVGGGALLLRTTGQVDTFAVIGPALLILIGLAIMFGRGLTRGPAETGDRVNSFNVFSGSNLGSRSRRFEGGTVGAVFGGAEIDLRDAGLAPGASMDVFTAFGGTEIKVPRGWHVVTRGFPIFGGIDNATTADVLPEDAPVLTINATVLFGGLDVKH